MLNQNAFSQSFNDISGVDFMSLNDSQIDLLLRRAGAEGYNQFDLLKIARSQGYSLEEIDKLDKRFKSAINSMNCLRLQPPLEDTRLRKQWLQDIEIFRETDSDIFGYNVSEVQAF